MPERNNSGSAVSAIVLIVLISLVYFGGFYVVNHVIEEADHAKDRLELSLQGAEAENEALRSLINEIAQDNADLYRLSGRSPRPTPYPLSRDPSVEPHR